MACRWAKIATPEAPSFSEIMSEELAKDLQEKENRKALEGLKNQNNKDKSEIAESPVNADCRSDEALARILQMQYDKEHDKQLRRTEEKFNGIAKVKVSLSNFERAPHNSDFESDSEEEEIPDKRDKEWDRFDKLEKQIKSIPPCGYKTNPDGSVTTKHDIVMNGRKNACKILSFPPEFLTGDGESFDMKISNKVYNSLKLHSKHEENKRHRMKDKRVELATAEFGIDEPTRIILYKLINNKQFLQKLNGTISTGKEAMILHAYCNPYYEEQPLPEECAIKIFSTVLSEYKQRDKYIKDDHRFKDRVNKQQARRTVDIWAEKEMANLYRLAKAGIPCPRVLLRKKHVIIMDFLGENNLAAPKLKDAIMSYVDHKVAYEEVVKGMKKMYTMAKLVHADLSEYNILWHKSQCYFIDVSQSVDLHHQKAFELLYRDCYNIRNFFRKTDPNIPSADELFKSITGCCYDDEIALKSLQETFKMKPHLVDRPGVDFVDRFEHAWNMSKNLPSTSGSASKSTKSDHIRHNVSPEESCDESMVTLQETQLPLVEPPLA